MVEMLCLFAVVAGLAALVIGFEWLLTNGGKPVRYTFWIASKDSRGFYRPIGVTAATQSEAVALFLSHHPGRAIRVMRVELDRSDELYA